MHKNDNLILCTHAGVLELAHTVHRTHCPERECELDCKHGLKHDLYDCDVCECAVPKSAGSSALCPEVSCYMACEFGFEQDEAGCSVCR